MKTLPTPILHTQFGGCYIHEGSTIYCPFPFPDAPTGDPGPGIGPVQTTGVWAGERPSSLS